MPGLDAYEQMSMREQDDFMASIKHWGNVPEGGRAAQSGSDALVVEFHQLVYARAEVESADGILLHDLAQQL